MIEMWIPLIIGIGGGALSQFVVLLASRRKTKVETDEVANRTLRDTIVSLRETGAALSVQIDWYMKRVEALELRLTELEDAERENRILRARVQELEGKLGSMG